MAAEPPSASSSGSEPEPECDGPEGDTDEVRRLLASIRVSEPMPDDVVARLDQALADLLVTGPSNGVRRGRQVVTALLAAAVVVLGVVLVSTLRDNSTHVDQSTPKVTAGGQQTLRPSSPTATAPVTPPAPLSSPDASQLTGGDGTTPALSSANFAVGAARFAASARGLVPARQWPAQTRGASVARMGPGCPGPAELPDSAGVRVVRLDGRIALLVLEPDTGSGSTAVAWSCDGTEQLAQADLPDTQRR